MKIALDAMGGDLAPQAIIQGAFDAISRSSEDLEIILVGNKDKINSCLDKTLPNQISIHHASEIVTMDDDGSKIFKSKPNSSIVQGLKLVKENNANAFISAGHTGAVMATSLFLLGRIPDVKRPCLGVCIKTQTGGKIICDVGANPDANPEQLLQFAIMGSIAVQNTENINTPSIGLLNVGTEELKGNEKSQETSELLKKSSLNYIGFVEGDDIYKGNVDVIVCDGFEGNIALKASEGVAKMFSFFIKKSFTKNIFTKLVAILASPVMKDFRSKVDPGKYNGASLLGLKGVVVKSHGNADIDSFFQAIREAYLEAHARITDKISEQLTRELQEHK